ncbi:hypothetical protein EVAR_2475_1 [Eumeta japonica]|uniref:Uncharacterized protein n=1 Tax=Eumeta variegata TaxID=151549 RepID=A0A4C1SRS8_EUMVA|nr:hypothetical protein EVAR_2475_1 [Eumeta japonica]
MKRSLSFASCIGVGKVGRKLPSIQFQIVNDRVSSTGDRTLQQSPSDRSRRRRGGRGGPRTSAHRSGRDRRERLRRSAPEHIPAAIYGITGPLHELRIYDFIRPRTSAARRFGSSCRGYVLR